MGPTAVTAHPPARPYARWIVALFAGLLAAAVLLVGVPPAMAASDDADEYPYAIAGNVRTGGEPVEGAVITVTGGDFEGSAVSEENGAWRIGVPSKDEAYTIELDPESLPEGVEAPEDFAFSVEAEFGAGNTLTRNFTLEAADRVTTSFVDQLLSRTVNGLNFGLMLALAAIGLSLVFGTTGLSNFAHGEMVTFGALSALLFSVGLGWSIWLAIPAAIAVAAIFGLAMDTGIWRPLRRRGLGTVQLMIVSIGLSLALRYLFQMAVGGGTSQLPGAVTTPIPGLGPIRLSVTDVISMGISLVVIGVVAWWLMRTRLGRATRAVSDNPSLAAASGIDVDAVVRVVWIVAAALAGLSGIRGVYFRPGIRWDMGTSILLLLFAAVVLGGLGTAFGALIGALIVGLLVEVSTLWIPSDLKFAGALVVLIVIMLFRPQGILGRRERIG